MNPDRNRWFILAACVFANLVSGAAYASSVFKRPMMEHLGCTEQQWALAFSLTLAFLPVGMLMSGRIVDKGSPRTAVALGALLMGLGAFLAGYARSLTWLYMTFGVMMSLGNGSSYGAVIAVSVRWFPDRRGMASGLTVGALGFGTAIIAPFAQWLLQQPGLGVLGMFRVLGITFFLVLALASLVMRNPPADFAPREELRQSSDRDLRWTEMLARPRFWLLYTLYASGVFSGLMVISQAATIAQELTHLSKAASAGVVSLLGLANAAGRVTWGAVSDRIGRLPSLALMFLVTMIAMLLLPQLATDRETLIAAVIVIGLCFGGYLGTFPSLCADSFGETNAAVNYALLFSAFSVAGLAGPYVAARFAQGSGGYAAAFRVAASVCSAGLILTLIASFTDRRCRRSAKP
ncbi:MAG: L-lactate MFS transporter [Armatimonadota bacterium]